MHPNQLVRSFTFEIAPFRSPAGDPVLVVTDRDQFLVTRLVAHPWQTMRPGRAPDHWQIVTDNLSPLLRAAPRVWRRGVHVAAWRTHRHPRGIVLIAVDSRGRWLTEGEAPAGTEELIRVRDRLEAALAEYAVLARRVRRDEVDESL